MPRMRKPGANHQQTQGQVLVAIVNSLRDLEIARAEGWYRIPVSSATRWLKGRWPPQWLAFYQTKVFGDEAYAVRYYARVREIREADRAALFPGEPAGDKAGRRYYQVLLDGLQCLDVPIISRRWRRIVFIPTTWAKFCSAAEINDLFDESPLEDLLWAALRQYQIEAERQLYVPGKAQQYALDFAVYYEQGKLDLETDGDSWHATPERVPLDNARDNELTGLGWAILRFNTAQIQESTEQYCIPAVMETINRLGGLTTQGLIPRRFDPENPDRPRQLSLFGR